MNVASTAWKGAPTSPKTSLRGSVGSRKLAELSSEQEVRVAMVLGV